LGGVDNFKQFPFRQTTLFNRGFARFSKRVRANPPHSPFFFECPDALSKRLAEIARVHGKFFASL